MSASAKISSLPRNFHYLATAKEKENDFSYFQLFCSYFLHPAKVSSGKFTKIEQPRNILPAICINFAVRLNWEFLEVTYSWNGLNRIQIIHIKDGEILTNGLIMFARGGGSGSFNFSQEIITEWPSNFATLSFYLLDILLPNLNELGVIFIWYQGFFRGDLSSKN